MRPRDVVPAFDAHLHAAGETFSGVVVGGAALVLLGVVRRATDDVDVLDPDIPAVVLGVAQATAASLRAGGQDIDDDWLNNGPKSLQDTLPTGWRERVVPLYAGKALTFWALGRSDLLKTKLFALCDRGTDRADCLAMRPTATELREALSWVEWQDANVNWPEHVRATFAELGRELGHGF